MGQLGWYSAMARVRRLDEGHDMSFGLGMGNIARDSEAVAQKVRTRLCSLKGEWFLDTEHGVPYLDELVNKPVNQNYAEAVLKQTILDTEGVESVSEWSATLDRGTRRFNVSCVVSTVYGTTANIRVVR